MKGFKSPENKTIQQLEQETLQFWQKNNIFERSVNERPQDNLYVFYDGPPFISGLPHYGHLLGSIAKDIIPRYWTMKGKRVERVWGWDAHGLTVENKVQTKLGIKNRRDIEKYGLEKFIQECYKYTSETSAEWEWYVDKIGRWVDFKNSYKTTDQTYMESVIWAFKQLYDKGLIYEGIYTSLYCTTCGTPVSNFEITMDNTYKDYEDPGITVKFPVVSNGKYKDVNILAWTTTPWTMPSNRALVVLPEATYSLVEFENQKYFVAQPRLERVFSGKKYKILEEVNGEVLVGLEYRPPYTIFASKQGEFKVYAYENMVTMEEGTGVVHSAPGFGEVDTEMGRHYGLTIMLTLDDEGKFVKGTQDKNPYEGVFYAKANATIIEDLKTKDTLFDYTPITHRVPYHDRCDTLLIQRAQNSWFVNVQKLKDQLIEHNEHINWVPEHLKHGRFEIGLKQAPDWCISRTRFWATPMPVWVSESGEKIVVGSIEELEKLSGQKVKDLHRPYIDEIVIKKDGKTFKRIPEVLDSWFEAGSMPFAQIHYPMENEQKFEQNFPGDYIVEYIAQTRAWFFFMHVLSTSLFETHSFKNVISTGVMAGSDGRKMSKTYNNYTDPKLVLENIGGDALRLFLMGSPLMEGENANFDEEELKTKLKNIINPLWNSLKFFLLYAEEFKWLPEKSVLSKNLLDRWIIARTHEFVKQFAESIEKYEVPDAVNPIGEFVDDLSRWYVRRSRDRISAGDNEALSTLYFVLKNFAKASAPAIPFISEQIYLHLKVDEKEPESVHLCTYPEYDQELIDSSKPISEGMKITRALTGLGHDFRASVNIPLRQPLSTIEYKTASKLGEEFELILSEELNVKLAKYSQELTEDSHHVIKSNSSGSSVSGDTRITPELEVEGNKREFIRTIQGLRKTSGLSIQDYVIVTYPDDDKWKKVVQKYSDEIAKKVSAKKIVVGTEFSVEKV